MRVGMIGTGAISHKHVQAYRNIGYEITVCSDEHPAFGRAFSERYGIRFAERWQDVCSSADVDFVDVCTFPNFRLAPVELCAASGKHIQVQKPMAIDLADARRMIELARSADIRLGVVSQHRFDDASLFLKPAIDGGRLGKILQADAYVKWWRSDEYYSRPIKGSWEVEGGGALINQAIHQIDILLWLCGPVSHVHGEWELGAAHKIESEDVVSALLRYRSGAIGVVQAATAIRPGYPERVEIHGTKGSAIITGDKLTAWDVEGDTGAPVASNAATGASDPMAISLTPFERQFRDFGAAIRERRDPVVSGEEGFRALQFVQAVYQSCRHGRKVMIDA
ncbi:MAG TPA: Gfo/Idh/MocA family oxidoreductase [Bryobacteraceae bacterium]|nr:Gfo/Idh/MocA family oxidoreductase [Bryobacteraceae bacterium]